MAGNEDTSDCKVYRVGRKYETTTNCDTEMKNCTAAYGTNVEERDRLQVAWS
jgi:hypothetical protein